MKIIKLAVVLALVTPANSVLAQSAGMKGMDMKNMDMKSMDMMKGMETRNKAQGTAHKGAGTVKKVDPAKGSVTLAHGPIKTLNWPAMTMDFTVKDKHALASLKPGQKVDFTIVEQPKSQYVITEIAPPK